MPHKFHIDLIWKVKHLHYFNFGNYSWKLRKPKIISKDLTHYVTNILTFTDLQVFLCFTELNPEWLARSWASLSHQVSCWSVLWSSWVGWIQKTWTVSDNKIRPVKDWFQNCCKCYKRAATKSTKLQGPLFIYWAIPYLGLHYIYRCYLLVSSNPG